MIVSDFKEGKLVSLSSVLDTRSKVLNLIYFFLLFIGATAFLRGLLFEYATVAGAVVVGSAAIVLYVASYRFINKAFSAEKIFINKLEMHIINKGIFKTKSEIFDVQKISKFRLLAKSRLTRHPLAGDSFDYLGFQTEQKVIDDMHGENRIAFDYLDKTITFGRSVYSWEFDELEILLYDLTGIDFRYDDNSEKKFQTP